MFVRPATTNLSTFASAPASLAKAAAGELDHGSYLQRPLANGEHLVTPKPGQFSKIYEHIVKLECNQTLYLEFELPAFFLANTFMLGFGMAVREAEQARADMQGLKGVNG